MKKLTYLFLAVLIAAASAVSAAVPPIEVTVSDADGNLVHRGRLAPDGTFATPAVEPGNYVLQFKTNSSAVTKQDFVLVASAGKRKTYADSVPGERFTGGGVAMRLEVGRHLNIFGQVTPMAAGGAVAGTNVRIVNGHRYVWQGPATGTNVKGRWVEEGVAPAYNITVLTPDEIHRMQERGMAALRN